MVTVLVPSGAVYFRAIRGAVSLKPKVSTQENAPTISDFRAIRGAVSLKLIEGGGNQIQIGNISAPFVARSH